MLSISEIINILEPKQLNNANEISIDKKFNNKSKLNNFYDLILDNSLFYKYENTIKTNSIISSLLGICDETYLLYSDNEKNGVIKEVINKMYIDLDEKIIHKRFGYTRKKKFSKNILKELLLNNKIDFDNNENDNLKQYLADYFKLNIIILIFDENNNYIGSNYFKYNNYVDSNPSLTNIIIEKSNNKYHPILKNNQKNIISLSEDKELLVKLKKFVPQLILDVIQETNTESEEEEYNIKDKKSLMNLKLDKIKLIAKENNISLKKLSEKTGKLINLKKEEIIDDILEKAKN